VTDIGHPIERGALTRLARFVLGHRKAVIAFWLVLLVAGAAAAGRWWLPQPLARVLRTEPLPERA
jgi:hypothetical protein